MFSLLLPILSLPLIPVIIPTIFSGSQTYVNPNMIEGSSNRGWGLTGVFYLIENPGKGVLMIVVLPMVLVAAYVIPLGLCHDFLALGLLPFSLLLTGITCLWMGSRMHDNGPINKDFEDLLIFKDKSFENTWKGRKIPIETALEAYQDQKLDFKDGDVMNAFMHRYEIFRFSITTGHLKSLVHDLLMRVWDHSYQADKADVSDVYNKGNDFYGWFLDDRMLYSSGLFHKRDESIQDAQTRKLDKICNMLQLQPGEEMLDFGCGWGALACHAGSKFGAKVTGITLSQEQANFIAAKPEELTKNVNIKVMNAWDVPADKKYDKISCVEMSEHIGIRDYQKFQHFVRDRLKDDGIFYLQIAGLRRNWQYEDLIWGLYMNRYIFPGADASCPLYWDIEQLERAGWEVHEVENNGVHYGITIGIWYDNWVKNKAQVVAKYGEWAWRNWAIFLAWSRIIAAQGSSTVYMISMTKNFVNDLTSRKGIPKNQPQAAIDRTEKWVRPKKY